jgi:hypothetical protein
MLTLLLTLSLEAYASDAAYRQLEAGKDVRAVLSMLQARRHHYGLGQLRYCSRLAADCKENNRLQRQLGSGYHVPHRFIYTATNGMWPIHAFSVIFGDEPGDTESRRPHLRRFGADYDGHYWTVVLE